jgi:hypothetical protein
VRSLVRFQLAPRHGDLRSPFGSEAVAAVQPERRSPPASRTRGIDMARPRFPIMVLIRRAVVALGLAAIAAAAVRLRGSGGVPPRDGGWRELSGPELR